MQALRPTLVAVLLTALACMIARAPSDAELAERLTRHRQQFDAMCADYPALGVDLIGREPGIAMLARGHDRVFSLPTDADLAAAGLDRATYDAWAARLAAVDALQIEHTQFYGVPGRTVALTVDLRGLSVSGSQTELHCGAAAPFPVVPRADETAGASDGQQCAVLVAPTAGAPGWWVCRSWG